MFSGAWKQGWQCCGQELVGPSSRLDVSVGVLEVSAWTGVQGHRGPGQGTRWAGGKGKVAAGLDQGWVETPVLC